LKAIGTVQPFEKEYYRKNGDRVPVLIGAAAFDELRDQGVAFVRQLQEWADVCFENFADRSALVGAEIARLGLTYNFKNPHTDYQNGIDWHTDLEVSRFLTKQFYIGAVGYSFNQLTGDTGSGATLGPYLSRIAAVGPEAGILFPIGKMQGSLNLRGYWEFAAQNRSSGWNTWLVFSIAPPEEKTPKIVK
jgi:hypothetical protein